MENKKFTWDEYFMKIAETVALKSKDESTKIGAVIVGPNHEIRSTGFNGFPRGFSDNDPSKQVRPIKYKFFEHAERNAIYNAARFGASVDGCTIYCPWPPCSDCARAIIQSGIKRVINSILLQDVPERWMEDMIIAREMLVDCGVKVYTIDCSGDIG